MGEGVIARVPKEIKQEIEFFAKHENTDKSDIIRNLLAMAVKHKRLEYALSEYGGRKASLGKAAEIAKVPLSDFMEEAAKRNIPISYSKEDLKRDFKAVFG